MKNLFYLLLAMMLIGVSCEDSSKDVDSTPKGVVFASGTEMSAEFGSSGGSKSFSFSSDLDWEVTTSADWISVTPSSGTPSVKKFTVKASANDSFEERSGTVTMTTTDDRSYTIEVTQAAEEETFTINGNGEYEVSAAGGEVKVKVTTNLEYTVEIPAEAKEWLSVADTRAVIREETLTFTVAENASFDERSATVELKGADGKVLQSIAFKQKEYGGTIEVDEEYVVDAEGGELEVKLSTDIDFTTSIPEEAKSWISIVETRSMRSESVIFNIAINDDVKERSATINLQNAKGNDVASFVIRQKGGDALLELQNQYSISNMGGNFEVAVTTNLEYEVEISADATSWLSYVETRALRTDKLIFNATPNEGEAERSGTIKLIGEDNEELQLITVTQRGNIFEFAYSTNDGKPLDPYTTEGFGGEFVENIYDAATGRGVLKFEGAITTIPKQAFGLCENLTRIDIPEGITTIGASAFTGCSALEEITIPASVTDVGNEAFKNCPCKATINCEKVSFEGAGFTEVIIGDGVTTIGFEAFRYCDSLTSVTIPDSVTTIGDQAFYGCSSLAEFKGKFAADGGRCLIKDNTLIAYANTSGTTYTIPDSVTTIGENAFRGCESLTSVTIPNSVTTIGYGAFYNCNSLTNVTIPDSVMTIGYEAFYSCDSLTSVYCKATTPPAGGAGMFYNTPATIYIPEGSLRAYKMAEYWSEYADCFVECDFNSTMTISYTTSDGMPANANGLIISNSYQNGVGELKYFGKDIIPEYLFFNCDNLTSLTIPDSVTTIGRYAFEDCTSLTSVIIPDSVTTIGEGAFYHCDSLTSVTIPDSVTTIGDLAFYNCNGLTSVTIGDSVTTIGGWAFYWCTSLTSVTIPDSVTTIGDYAFYECTSLTSVTIGDSVTTIGDSVFDGCESLTSVTIGDSVTTIGEYAFLNCNSLTSVTIGNSVTTIGNSAFSWCESLTSVTIPDSVTTIGGGAFYYCSSLTSVTIPDSVTTIGDSAFSDCSSLTSVTIGDSVTTIGNYAFSPCLSLTSVYCKATTPPSLGYNAFKYYDNGYVNIGCPIYVPAESAESYRAAKNWSSYKSYIVGYDIETGEAFVSQIKYTSTTKVKTYDPSAFNVAIISNEWDETTGEGVITFNGELTTIGDRAFSNCDSLTSVTIPDSVTTIGDSAFAFCDSLTSVTIPDSVTMIGSYAFHLCSSLTSVTIGDSVATIGNSAFVSCSNLAKFKGKFAADGGRCLIKDNTLIAYANASGTTYTIPDSVTTIGNFAFRDCRSLTSLTIGDSVTTIGDSAFRDCDSLTSVTIPDSVTTIGDSAFAFCDSLTSVTIPDSVTTIGDFAFSYCESLTSVYCKATTPPSLGYNAFKYYDNGYVNIGCPIYVPAESVEAYKAASYWCDYAADIVGYNFETGEVVE